MIKDENVFLNAEQRYLPLRSRFALARIDVARARVAITLARNIWRVAGRATGGGTSNEEEESRNPKRGTDLAGSRSLGRGFANNGVVARGAFFRWRLDTHRIYILLLLLGKRSSAVRLFNTTPSFARSLTPPDYFTTVRPRTSERAPPPPPPPVSPDKSPSLSFLRQCAGPATKIEVPPGR